MVRNFPATTRQRVLVAAIAFAVASAPAAAPIAHADDLKHKKHKVEQRVKAARADLEDSSQAAYQGAPRSCTPPRPSCTGPRRRWPSPGASWPPPQTLDEQMQHELVAGRAWR